MNANDMKQREKGFCGLLRRAGIACIGISMTLTAMGQQVEQALKQFDTAPTAAAANCFFVALDKEEFRRCHQSMWSAQHL